MTRLNRKQAAEFLGVSTETLRRWEKEGEGPPFYRLSEKKIRYEKADLEAFLEESRVDPGASDGGKGAPQAGA